MSGAARLFFGAGLVALVAAALLHLLVQAGAIGYWAAATHLTLFGWITAMILGVSYHTMPVFLGRDFPYPRLTQVHCAMLCAGVTFATVGLASYRRSLVVAGLSLQLVAALLFAANSVLLIKRGVPRPHRPPVPPIAGQVEVDRVGSHATRAAALTLPLALLLLLGVYGGGLGATWVLAAEHLVTLGWIMLMIVGVAGHVLPRFSGYGGRGPAWARAQLRVHLLALLLMVPALGRGGTALFAAGAALMALALVLFAWTIWPSIAVLRPRPQPIRLSFEERSR